jgi:uncharacterized membrane protein YqhA
MSAYSDTLETEIEAFFWQMRLLLVEYFISLIFGFSVYIWVEVKYWSLAKSIQAVIHGKEDDNIVSKSRCLLAFQLVLIVCICGGGCAFSQMDVHTKPSWESWWQAFGIIANLPSLIALTVMIVAFADLRSFPKTLTTLSGGQMAFQLTSFLIFFLATVEYSILGAITTEPRAFLISQYIYVGSIFLTMFSFLVTLCNFAKCQHDHD